MLLTNIGNKIRLIGPRTCRLGISYRIWSSSQRTGVVGSMQMPVAVVQQMDLFKYFSVAKCCRNESNENNKKTVGVGKVLNKISKPNSSASKIISSLAKARSGALAKENIYTIPNVLTFSRLAVSPVIGYLLIHEQPFWALTLVVYSGVSDLLDGYIARNYNLQTVVGSVIDPLADKALMITLASCLCISGNIPIYMATLILGRDILLALSAIYYRYISLPPPKTFVRYWDFSIPSAEVHPTTISKYNTFLQMTYLGCSLLLPVIRDSFTPETFTYLLHLLKGLEYTTACTTIASGLSYVFSKNAVKILKKGE